MDKARRGALEPPLDYSARTKRFDREIRGSKIPYWGRDEKKLLANACPKKKYIILYAYKGSAWVGQGSTFTCPIQYSIE